MCSLALIYYSGVLLLFARLPPVCPT